MDLNMLETIQTNTLLNLSTVHLKEGNYKISIELSEQVNIFKRLFMDNIFTFIVCNEIKLVQKKINKSNQANFLATKYLL